MRNKHDRHGSMLLIAVIVLFGFLIVGISALKHSRDTMVKPEPEEVKTPTEVPAVSPVEKLPSDFEFVFEATVLDVLTPTEFRATVGIGFDIGMVADFQVYGVELADGVKPTDNVDKVKSWLMGGPVLVRNFGRGPSGKWQVALTGKVDGVSFDLAERLVSEGVVKKQVLIPNE